MNLSGPGRSTFDVLLWYPSQEEYDRWTAICQNAVRVGQSFQLLVEKSGMQVKRGDTRRPLVVFTGSAGYQPDDRRVIGEALRDETADNTPVLHLVAGRAASRPVPSNMWVARRTIPFIDPVVAAGYVQDWLAAIASSGTTAGESTMLARKVETAEATVAYLHSVIDERDADIARLRAELEQLLDLTKSLGVELLKMRGPDPVSSKWTAKAIGRVAWRVIAGLGILGALPQGTESALQLADRLGVPVPHAEAALQLNTVSPSGHRWNADDDVVVAARQALERVADLIEFADSCADDPADV